jgi:hypothetical protein
MHINAHTRYNRFRGALDRSGMYSTRPLSDPTPSKLLSQMSDIDLMIAKGWGGMPREDIPKEWRTVTREHWTKMKAEKKKMEEEGRKEEKIKQMKVRLEFKKIKLEAKREMKLRELRDLEFQRWARELHGSSLTQE